MQGECCCGTSDPCSGEPGISLTVTWTPGPATRTYFGQTFTPGETKTICPTFYDCGTGSRPGYLYSYPARYEVWQHVTASFSQFLTILGEFIVPFGPPGSPFSCPTIADYKADVGLIVLGSFNFTRYKSVHLVKAPSCGSPTTTVTTKMGGSGNINISSGSPTNFDALDAGVPIQDSSFGTLTTTGGVTLTWQRGSFPFNTCGLSTRTLDPGP